jgi:hypothetical protein
MPGQQGARSHDPVQPQAPGQQPSEGCEDGAVGPVRLLARQDRDLMPENQDLRVLGGIAPRQERQLAERPDHEQVGKADEHERRA